MIGGLKNPRYFYNTPTAIIFIVIGSFKTSMYLQRPSIIIYCVAYASLNKVINKSKKTRIF